MFLNMQKWFSCILGEQQSFPKPWTVLGWWRHPAVFPASRLLIVPRCTWTRTTELNRIWSWMCVGVWLNSNCQGKLGILTQDLLSWSYTIYDKCFLFQLGQMYWVQLARHTLGQWSTGRVGVDADARWGTWDCRTTQTWVNSNLLLWCHPRAHQSRKTFWLIWSR